MAIAADKENLKSFIDTNNTMIFVLDNFDLTSIRSSFGPRRISGRANFFKDFNTSMKLINPKEAVYDSDIWYYSLTILDTRDYNDDGIIDIGVCFIDKANEGSYFSITPYILTRYNKEMPLIAISFELYDERCLVEHP